MRLTRAAAYAVNALARIAAEGDGRHLAAAAAAPASGASPEFLAKILRELVRARVLRSVKGPGGGYRLARPLSRVTLLEVVEAVDGPLDNHCAPPPSARPDFDRRLEAACRRAAEALRRQLARVRLSDLAGGC
jgi:Rrf2 family protein